MSKKKIAIIGAGGFTGQELLKLLHNHPGVSINMITSSAYDGLLLGDVLPQYHYKNYKSLRFQKHPAKASDLKGFDLVLNQTIFQKRSMA